MIRNSLICLVTSLLLGCATTNLETKAISQTDRPTIVDINFIKTPFLMEGKYVNNDRAAYERDQFGIAAHEIFGKLFKNNGISTKASIIEANAASNLSLARMDSSHILFITPMKAQALCKKSGHDLWCSYVFETKYDLIENKSNKIVWSTTASINNFNLGVYDTPQMAVSVVAAKLGDFLKLN